MKPEELNVQEYVSLGYVFLVVLGITSDVIFYRSMGVDILNYSTILDVLISPINILAQDPRVLLLFALTGVVGYYLIVVLIPRYHFKNREKAWYRKLSNVEKLDRKYGETNKGSGIVLMAIMVLSLFLGFGLGRGNKLAKRMAEGELKTSHAITFADGVEKEVRVIGQNSGYVFFVPAGATEVSIAPIVQNIREITRLQE